MSYFSRRNFIRTASVAGAGLFLTGRAPGLIGKATKRKPNIVYVFADQLRADVVSCYGGDQIKTTHMDGLANQGCRMNNCISTWPLCTPYRGMMLTGRHPMHNGCVSNTTPLLGGLPTIGTVCKANGYATGYIGKWHLESDRLPFVPPERRQGFDYWAVRNCDHIYFNSFYCGNTPEHIPLPGWEPEAQTRLAVDFMRNHKDEPFCLMLSWGPPHDPYVAPDSYKAMLPKESLRFRGNVNERRMVDDLLKSSPSTDPKVLSMRKRERTIIDSDPDLLGWWQAYLAMTKSLDDCLGTIMVELEQLGLTEDTIVVFTSDHGDMMGSHRMGSKQMPFEESIRVPFLLRYPRAVEEGRVSDALFSPIDIMPTLLSLAGIAIPQGLDGLDFKQAILGIRHDQREALLLMKMLPGGTPLFANNVREWRGVRTKQHTYARLLDTGPWLLFDNQADPLQLNNRVHDESMRGLCASMEQQMALLLKDAGDPGETAPIQRFANENRRKYPPRKDRDTAGKSSD